MLEDTDNIHEMLEKFDKTIHPHISKLIERIDQKK